MYEVQFGDWEESRDILHTFYFCYLVTLGLIECAWSSERSNERNKNKIELFLCGILSKSKSIELHRKKMWFFLKAFNTLSYYSSKVPQKWAKVYNILEIKNHEKSPFLFFEL